MSRVLTKVGGESSAPSYDFLRSKLHEVFAEGTTPDSVNAYDIIRGGTLWYVKAGIVNQPDARWHEYGITYRQTETKDGSWYESEMRDARGETVLGFAFAPDTGYQTAVYIPEQGTERCFRQATDAHYIGTLAIIEHTMFSEQMSFDAAQRFLRGE